MTVEERDRLAGSHIGGRQLERRRALSVLAPWAICALLGAWAAAGSLLLFPQLSNNNDEAVYLLQADALRNGYLFPPAPQSWESFLPWFGFHDQERFVLKYTPVHAAIIAASRSLFTTDRAALVLIAFAAAITCYLLARQVLRDRNQAALAAAFFALSPLVLIQSITFLSYLSAIALLQAFATALILGVRRRSARWLVAAGFLLGLGFFARPFDALLFAAPLGLWTIWIQRPDRRLMASTAGWLALGSLLPLAAMLLFFNAATGSPLDSPFNIDPSDTLGFGLKRMTPGGRVTDFTPALALEGLKGNARSLGSWSFGGIALLALAMAGLRKLRPRDPARWLALVAVTVPVGYLFFWGSYGTVKWGGPERLGPFYYLPVLTPLSILAARGFSRLWSRQRLIAGLLLVSMLGFSATTVMGAVDANRPYVEGRRELYRPLDGVPLHNALVFLPQVGGARLISPYALARNEATYDGPVVWAVDRGAKSNLEVMHEFPGRVPYRLAAEPGRKLAASPQPNFTSTLERQVHRSGAEITFDLILANPPDVPFRLEVTMGPWTDSFTVAPDRAGNSRLHVPLVAGPGSVRLATPVLAHATRPNLEPKERLEVTAWVPGREGEPDHWVAADEIEIIRSESKLEALVPAAASKIARGRFSVHLLAT
jgi:dolichyl-phosphate-mannose-protein mannosyltransferase